MRYHTIIIVIRVNELPLLCLFIFIMKLMLRQSDKFKGYLEKQLTHFNTFKGMFYVRMIFVHLTNKIQYIDIKTMHDLTEN